MGGVFITISFDTLKNKILGCWNGKNIGGVLGAPHESWRRVNNVSFYEQNLSSLPPNDDLDLQLVWLAAVERFGNRVDAQILGDYWQSFVIPNWSEYGTGKRNLAAGMLPPLSGSVNNTYAESCGAFIRSEIWACLCPGHPDTAVRYAYEDACVDHGGEGIYGEVFFAAVESAAFVENDKYKLIDIGLSYIPENCMTAKGIRLAIKCFEDGMTWKDARVRVMTDIPGSFGVQNTTRGVAEHYPVIPGCDAPNNIALAILGWMYGEDDFGKSLCIAVNGGEDTDCTAATLGAVLGIIHGNDGLPKKWTDPVGGKIVCGCADQTMTLELPKTVEELTERIIRQIPLFLGQKSRYGKLTKDYWCDPLGDYGVETAENMYCENEHFAYEGTCSWENDRLVRDLLKFSPYTVKQQFTCFEAAIDYMDEPFISVGRQKKIRFMLKDNKFSGHQLWADVRLHLPDGVRCLQGNRFSVPIKRMYLNKTVLELDIIAEEPKCGRVDMLFDVGIHGRASYGVMKGCLYLTASAD